MFIKNYYNWLNEMAMDWKEYTSFKSILLEKFINKDYITYKGIDLYSIDIKHDSNENMKKIRGNNQYTDNVKVEITNQLASNTNTLIYNVYIKNKFITGISEYLYYKKGEFDKMSKKYYVTIKRKISNLFDSNIINNIIEKIEENKHNFNENFGKLIIDDNLPYYDTIEIPQKETSTLHIFFNVSLIKCVGFYTTNLLSANNIMSNNTKKKYKLFN